MGSFSIECGSFGVKRDAQAGDGGDGGMPTAPARIAWPMWRRSVAIMFVAVATPVARLDSAVTSRPE